MSNLFWLTDAQMERLRRFFPKSCGVPRADGRRVPSGIIFINRNGWRWCDAPREYGPPKTLYIRWKRWGDKGILARTMQGLASEAAVRKTVMIDATYLKGHRTATSLPSPDWILANRGCDSDWFRDALRDKGIGPHDVKFEHKCHDVGHLCNLQFCMDIGWFKGPVFIQFIFGILGGIGPEVDNLIFIRRTADERFGDDYRWSVLGAGGAQIGLVTSVASMGRNVREGLEDRLQIARRLLADSNAGQVTKIRCIIQDLGSEIAAPDEARETLGLKGGDRFVF